MAKLYAKFTDLDGMKYRLDLGERPDGGLDALLINGIALPRVCCWHTFCGVALVVRRGSVLDDAQAVRCAACDNVVGTIEEIKAP